jgi:hypothetical protein
MQETHLSVGTHGDEPNWTVYRIEQRGAGGYVALIDR